MNKVVAVALREFLATVRTKAFLLSVVLMPALICVGIFGETWAEKASRAETRAVRRLAVVDYTGQFLDAFSAQVNTYNAELPNQPLELLPLPTEEASQDELRQRVNRGELYGYVVVYPNALALDGEGCAVARKDNQLQTGRRLERMINEAIFGLRCSAAGFDPAQIVALRREVPLRWINVQTGGDVAVHPMIVFMAPFAFMFLLFMGTFGISQGLLTTVIEEKSSRVIEVLLSALSPLQLLAGKIIGMVSVGLLLLLVWGGVGLAFAQRFNAGELVNGYRITMALLYFLPGFLLMSSLLAAIGSACNELKDAQSMTFPVTLTAIVPMVFWYYFAEHPDSMLSLALSFVPPITPFVMILRVCADPRTPVWQVMGTLAVLWLSVFGAMWVAGRVFRTGVLMYGKPPSLRELARWVRQA